VTVVETNNPFKNESLWEIAAEHATHAVPLAGPCETCGELRRRLIAPADYDCAGYVVVTEDNVYRGLVRLEDVLRSPEETVILSIADGAPSVAPGMDQEHAVWQAVQHGEAALPVVDAHGAFLGLIPPDRVVAILLRERDEDMARLGGFLNASSMARLATEEPLLNRFWHRLPWLLVGLAGALLAAQVLGRFEMALEKTLLLAFFIPGVVYLADAIGTQTEAVIVRGLSVGVRVRRILGLELATGAGIGVALALAGGLAVGLIWHHWGVALTVALTILATASVATVIALLLPWLFSRFKLDPAYGAGPLATVIQDVLSILIYLQIAHWVLDS